MTKTKKKVEYGVDHVIEWQKRIEILSWADLYALEQIVQNLIVEYDAILAKGEYPEKDKDFILERINEYTHQNQAIHLVKMKKHAQTFKV